jgi:hypothetical protein
MIAVPSTDLGDGVLLVALVLAAVFFMGTVLAACVWTR